MTSGGLGHRTLLCAVILMRGPERQAGTGLLGTMTGVAGAGVEIVAAAVIRAISVTVASLTCFTSERAASDLSSRLRRVLERL